MTTTKTQTIHIFQARIKRMFFSISRRHLIPVFSVFATVLFVSYLGLIGQTVFQAVEEKTTEGTIRDITMEVATLEGEYLQLVRGVGKEKAVDLGLFETKEVSYVTIPDTLSFLDTTKHAF